MSLTTVTNQLPGQVRIHSQLSGPIERLSWIRQSLLFAELSLLSYYRDPLVRQAAGQLGLTKIQFLDRDGAQAYVFSSAHDCVVACRGTESTEWNDIQADVNAGTVVAETVGRVHRGFKQEVDDLWPMLERALAGQLKPTWFTGHSLGAAMATICAGRSMLSAISADPRALFTYGSPRVGNARYINYVALDHRRWVNNNDLVTRLPPVWFGYRHCGCEIYLDRHGKIRRLTGWPRFRDRVRGLLLALSRWKVDYFADHSIDRYVQHIHAAVVQDELGGRSGARRLIFPRRRTPSRPQRPAIVAVRRRTARPSVLERPWRIRRAG